MTTNINFPEKKLTGDDYFSPVNDRWLRREKAWQKSTDLDANPPSFVTLWKTSTDNDSITLPLVEGAIYSFEVDWGDGQVDKITSWDQAEKTHEYATEGEYFVGISGVFSTLNFTGSPSRTKLIKVLRLGDCSWTSLGGAFSGCTALVYFDSGQTLTSTVVSTKNMLSGTTGLLELIFDKTFTTESVLDMSYMFSGCSAPVIDVSWFDTEIVQNMDAMFEGTSFDSIDLTTFNTRNVLTMAYTFADSKMTSVDVTGLDFSLVQNMQRMFGFAENIKIIDFSSIALSSLVDINEFAMGTTNLDSIRLPSMPIVQDASGMFRESGIRAFTYIFSASLLDAREMFYQAKRLSSVDLSGSDFSNVTDMFAMFYQASALPDLSFNGFDLSSVVNISYLAAEAVVLKSLDLTNVNLSVALDMSHLLDGALRLTSFSSAGINTAILTDMSYMFNGCSYITVINFEDFDTAFVTDMSYMMANAFKVIPHGLESLNISSLLDATNMMRNANEMPVATYDAILLAWAAQA